MTETGPPLEWTYQEDQEPVWTADKYEIRIISRPEHIFRPYQVNMAAPRRATPAAWRRQRGWPLTVAWGQALP
jgi:hypothetical protein